MICGKGGRSKDLKFQFSQCGRGGQGWVFEFGHRRPSEEDHWVIPEGCRVVDLRILKDVNALWSRIYPYLAVQVMKHYGRGDGEVLELGPFSGGIFMELVGSYPGLNLTIAAFYVISSFLGDLRKEGPGALAL
jgi:hypothetical protein